jgi:hypothetical protein
VRGQNVRRLALVFLVLVPDLSSQLNDRKDDSDSAEHLSDGVDHLPVHAAWLMNDGTNRKQKKLPRFKESSSNGTSAPAIRLFTHFRSLKDFDVVDKNGYSSFNRLCRKDD